MSFGSDKIFIKLQSAHVFKPFKQYAPGLGCRGICEHSDLTIVPKRHKGYTCQAEGIKYCKRCAVYFKPGTGVYCPCCKQKLKIRGRSKQSKAFREKQREALERQLNRSQEDHEVQKSLLETYYWYKCRSQCDFKTDNVLEAKQHKELGHGVKRIPIIIHQLLAKETNIQKQKL